MVGLKELATANKGIDLDQQRALVAGGTQGIGAGIAERFAKAGAGVWIIGRNEQKANEVLAKLRQASAEYATQNAKSTGSSSAQHEFFKADLSDPKEMDRVTAEINKRAGKAGVDYLVECQGGPPTGTFKPIGHSEFAFSVQCLSRFRIAERLLQAGTIKQGVLIVAVPGMGGKSLDVDDVDFRKKYDAGRWWGGPIGMARMGLRDSAVLDCVAQSFAKKYPSQSFIHVAPGAVATEAPANVGFPWPIPTLARIFMPYIARRPSDFAEMPFYLLANPEGKKLLRNGEVNGFGPWMGRQSVSACAQDDALRDRLWDRLQGFFA
ncbi:hypothetical protein OC845_002592 [Tilletia horrida]|nr:hypothetical protein OC845_002592 [Tilletia horrida]